MQNDELIVSKRSAECPEDDEDDCIYDVEANKKDNLIYPMTVVTTRKPRQYAPLFSPRHLSNFISSPSDSKRRN